MSQNQRKKAKKKRRRNRHKHKQQDATDDNQNYQAMDQADDVKINNDHNDTTWPDPTGFNAVAYSPPPPPLATDPTETQINDEHFDQTVNELIPEPMYNETEIMLLTNTNLELQNEIIALKQKLLERDESKNDQCYIRDEVLEYNSINKEDVEMRSQIKEKQTKIKDAFSIHVNRLEKWNAFSDKLQNEFKNGGQNDNANANEEEEDEKKAEESEITKLLNLYRNCIKLLVKQQSRTEDIGEYVVSLSKSKKELKNIVKEYTVNQQPTQQKYDQLCATYTNLKLKREQLQGQVAKMMQEINQITDEENKINKAKCETLDSLNISVVEKEKYDELLTKCKSLTHKYNKFEINVDNTTEEIQTDFATKWDQHERIWPKWSVNDIMCWIEYLIHDNKVKLSKDVNLDEIEQEMNKQKITGKSLEEMEKLDLKLFGFTAFDDITQIYKRIRELVSKYPDINESVDIGNGDNVEGGIQITSPKVQIPQEYICPISGKIMIDPIIYDGITFDRNNFLQYVKENGTIPKSDEQYDEDEGLFKNRKLKQKIDAFLAVNPQFVNEGV